MRSAASRLIGRRFSRFAFPDEIVPWFKPLESVIDSKHNKEASAEGRMFQLVDELRVEPSSPFPTPPRKEAHVSAPQDVRGTGPVRRSLHARSRRTRPPLENAYVPECTLPETEPG